MEFQTLKVALADQVATIELNRPERANAMEPGMWTELRDAMRWLDETEMITYARDHTVADGLNYVAT